MGKLKDLAEKCCTQETFVIENPGPKLLAFINDMRERKNKMIEESKREYIRHAFLSDDNMHNTFYWYKDAIKYKVNLNDKYTLHILTENYPDGETDEKLEKALESFGYEGDVIFLKNNKNIYLSKTRNEIRPDITQSYKNGNLDNSGFRASIFKKNIERLPASFDLSYLSLIFHIY